MLKIFSKIGESTIPNAGLGVFAGQKIKKGDIVWEFNQGTTMFFDNKKLKKMPTMLKSMFTKYGELYQGNRVHYLDDTKFINHNDQPNVIHSREFKNIFEEDIKISLIASRDIEIGEELFLNYYQFDEEADFGLK